jgi:hypothetical protein
MAATKTEVEKSPRISVKFGEQINLCKPISFQLLKRYG